MKTLRAKSIVFTLLLGSYAFSAVPIDSFTTINAFSSASLYHSLTVHPSKVYKNKAEIKWEEYWEFDNKVMEYKLRWGKAPGVFSDSIVLMPYQHQTLITTTMNNLEPNTKYYADFYRDYNRKALPPRDFVFTTPPLDPIIPIPVDDSGYIDPSPVKTFKYPALSSSQKVSSVILSSISGQRVYALPVTSVEAAGNVFKRSAIVPGLYVAYFKSANNSIITSRKILVNH